MKKLVLISTYFGTLPEYFNIWCKSAAANSNIDFFIYTDCDYPNTPDNVHLIKMTFSALREKVQALFDFKISLKTPYKICDYKPAYGLIFEDDIKDYNYWGHIDIDTVLGRLEAFLPDRDYEKIYRHGHLCIYKNTFENNRRFMTEIGMSYKDVFTTENILVFDESAGIQKNYELMGIETYTPRCYADITRQRHNFTLSTGFAPTENGYINNHKHQVFYYENASVFRAYLYKGEIITEEFNYIHFSSRKMPVHFDDADSFFITPTGFYEKTEAVQESDFEKYNGATDKQNKQALRAYKKWYYKRTVKKVFTSIKEKIK